jgi:YD repeat-containing protein
VTGKTQPIAGVTQSVGYAYTNGNLTGLTTASGQTITYGYNGSHQVTSVAVNASGSSNWMMKTLEVTAPSKKAPLCKRLIRRMGEWKREPLAG